MTHIVFCRERADDYSPDWKGELPGLTYEAEPRPDADLRRSLGFEPAMVVRVNAARDARMEAYELALWIAKRFRGAIFSEDTGEHYDVVERGPATLADLVERWRTAFVPKIEQSRAEARARAKSLEESYARAQAGERVEHFDWRMDFDDDQEDARAAAAAKARIAQMRARAAAEVPVEDPNNLRQLMGLLTPTVVSLLERAITDVVGRNHTEVTVFHWLLAILRAKKGDGSLVCEAIGVEQVVLEGCLHLQLDRLPTGTAKPTFAPHIAPLIRSAWALVDRDGGETRIRTGCLVWAALEPPLAGQELPWWRRPLREMVPRTATTADVRKALDTATHEEVEEARRPRS